MTEKRALILIAIAALLILGVCGRKGNENPPERIGDLRVVFEVIDETGRLGDSCPVRITLYDDTLHSYEIAHHRLTVEPSVTDSVDFLNVNARSAFYYVEAKVDYRDERDATCRDIPVYVSADAMRRLPIDMVYEFTGMTCQ
jgi:hypothetical protein